MSEGWISLHRRITEHWLWKKSKPLSPAMAWIDILMVANHTEAKFCIGDTILFCGRGESLNSLDTWGKRWGWNRSRVRRFLKLLESDSMVELKPQQKTTHLIVCQYDSYQNGRNANETQVKRKRNANETQVKHK